MNETTEMQPAIWYFTYGSNHETTSGESLGRSFTAIKICGEELGENDGFSAARSKMLAARGPKWSMQYDSEEACGVHRHGLRHVSLEYVTLPLPPTEINEVEGDAPVSSAAPIFEITPASKVAYIRADLKNRIALLDKVEALLELLPVPIMQRCSVQSHGLDLDGLTHSEVTEAMKCLRAGRWTRTPNHANPTNIDYETDINGLHVRLWSAAAPGSCRIVEWQEEIPASTVTRRKLVCAGE